MEFDYDLWPQVHVHDWKYRLRDPRTPSNLIQLHATRSGRTTIRGRPWNMDDDRKSASNWFISPENKVEGAAHEAAMCSVLIGNGTLTRVIPDEFAPHHSLGHADATGLSIEICQPLDDVPFLDEDLRLAAEVCAEWSEKYGIRIKVLPFLSSDNHEAPGYVRHDRSAQGNRVGKSDPGRQFPTDAAFEAMVRGEDNMTAEQNRQRLNKEAVMLKLAGIAAAGGKATKEEADWGVITVTIEKLTSLSRALGVPPAGSPAEVWAGQRRQDYG